MGRYYTRLDKDGNLNIIKRYFLHKYLQEEKGSGIVLITMEGYKITERSWRFRQGEDPRWRASHNRVTIITDWFFIGNGVYREITESEAFDLLPEIAINTINDPVKPTPYVISTEDNPYEEPNDYPRHMLDVTSAIIMYLNLKKSPWLLTFDSQLPKPNKYENTPYLQYLNDANSPHYFEITDNNYIEDPKRKITNDKLTKLYDMGWNSSDGEHPNLWIEFSKETSIAEIAKTVSKSFYIAYKPSYFDSIIISPHIIELGMPIAEFALIHDEYFDTFGITGIN